jgi:hypothetical protein
MMPDLFAQSQARKRRVFAILQYIAAERIVDLDNNWHDYQTVRKFSTGSNWPPGGSLCDAGEETYR